MDKLSPNGRKTYRLTLLREIYESYFKNNGEAYSTTVNKDEDFEKYYALQYLISKNYITRNSNVGYDDYSLSITFEGIDLVEN